MENDEPVLILSIELFQYFKILLGELDFLQSFGEHGLD